MSGCVIRVLAAAIGVAVMSTAGVSSAYARPRAADRPSSVRYETLTTRFEPNVGQTDARARFVARSRDGVVFLTDRGVLLKDRRGAVVSITAAGARSDVRLEASQPLAGSTSYFRGGDAGQWQSGLRGFARVRASDVYPGIDMVYYGAAGHLEYDFVVAPGADPRCIRLEVGGAERIDIDEHGDLVLATKAGAVRHRAPSIYQTIDGVRRCVAGGYALVGPSTVAFALGGFDPRASLVIDPEVAFATYLGGADFDDGADIAVDAAGSVYLTGSTASIDFPTESPFQGAIADPASTDAYVVKLAPDGASLVYATYLGGDGPDNAQSIVVDETGAALVAGATQSKVFPLASPLFSERLGSSDGFLAKIAPDGRSLVFSTLFGGSSDDQITDVAIRADHSIVVGGRTSSTDLPLKSAQQGVFGGVADGFVAILNAAASGLVASTYLGGNGNEQVDSIVIGPSDAVYASGVTSSTDFAACEDSPSRSFLALVSVNPLRVEPISCGDSEIAKCAAVGFGAGADFRVRALVAGGTSSLDVRSATVGSDLHLIRAREFGGTGQDYPDAVAAGPSGELLIAGDTDSTDLPVLDATQPSQAGDLDAFVAVLAPGTDTVAFATYLGGSGLEFPSGIVTDSAGNIYVTGVTFSDDFPTLPDSLQPAFNGDSDAFVVKITAPDIASGPDFALSSDPSTATAAVGAKGSLSVGIERTDGFTGSVTLSAPSVRAIKLKITPSSVATTGTAVTFAYKVKKKALPGVYPLVFTGKDSSGRSRTTTFTLTIR